MKCLLAFGLPVVFLGACALPAAAQIGSQNALGGKYLSPGMSRPLGGITPATGSRRGNYANSRRAAALPFAYSFYVPNYFDSFYGTDPYAPPPPEPAVAAPAPPVIINQYFSAPPPQAPPPQQADTRLANDQPNEEHKYYLIAYKNHTVYTALAYWIEDKTLHYVTSGNTHNQASIDLIDMDLTKKLNQSRAQ